MLKEMAIIKFAILTMIGTVISSIVLLGSELDVAASQNRTSITNDTSSNIEGHLIYEVHGKIVAQKMINSTAWEVSYAGVGRFTNGVDVTEVWTYIDSHTQSGVIQGVGHGMLKTVDNREIATSKGYGRGFPEEGKIVYPTAQLYSTNSTGRLAFLKDIVGFSDWHVQNSGNYSYKMWQFK
ncbi:MAG TPA: hypothetical protein VEH06_16085 [Candidatus Bathyarchaeia archaeon]|nr:hypothetical protein [Candidatus Bathyarchaeia archaeon]